MFPGSDDYKQRKVSVVVDGFPVVEMMVWAENPEQAAYQVCRVGCSIMREHLIRLSTIERYANGNQAANGEVNGQSHK